MERHLLVTVTILFFVLTSIFYPGSMVRSFGAETDWRLVSAKAEIGSPRSGDGYSINCHCKSSIFTVFICQLCIPEDERRCSEIGT